MNDVFDCGVRIVATACHEGIWRLFVSYEIRFVLKMYVHLLVQSVTLPESSLAVLDASLWSLFLLPAFVFCRIKLDSLIHLE